MKRVAAAALIALSPVTAQAGDPCPISFSLHDLGAPDWLDRDALLGALDTQIGWIGMRYSDVTGGLELTAVYDDSPARRAGLKTGDLITAIDGVDVSDPARAAALFDAMTAGATLQFTLSRDGKAGMRLPVTIGYHDPVTLAILNAIGRQDCRTALLVSDDAPARAALLAQMFDANRAFRCDDAHVALGDLLGDTAYDDVYLVRGSRRILITMPGWGSTCVGVTALDGDRLTNETVLTTLAPVIDGYVQDRFDNP
ncbi:PDZ domain-containing protein [Octadecabacter sp. R77987]|uniref:PDZ domain-containing protein n=1 Tax=Octadecabacter sp. R77987 TaxID=3093874 RepID=UPI00366B0359